MTLTKFTVLFVMLCSLTHPWTAIAEQDRAASKSVPIEAWGCNFNKGQDMNDLMSVVQEWNEWADETGSTNYNAFVMTPLFHPDGMNSMTGWMGNWTDWKSMGESLDTLYSDGGKIMEKFGKVWDCSSRGMFNGQIVRQPSKKMTGDAVATFYNCNLREGKTSTDLLSADEKWNKYLDSTSDESAIVNLWPGPGNPEGFDFKISVWVSSLSILGSDLEHWNNGGGWQTWLETYGEIVSCSDPGRGYMATRVREIKNQTFTK